MYDFDEVKEMNLPDGNNMFAFRFPGNATIFNFDEIREKKLPPKTKIIMFRGSERKGVFSFEEIRDMHLPSTIEIDAQEIVGQNCGHDAGRMSMATLLAKFG